MSLACYDFDGSAVRVLDRDGAPWFVAADVCRALEISNSRDAVSALDEDEKASVGIADTSSSSRKTVTAQVVSESGLYALIFKSRKSEAKKFRKWVSNEVLPAIRKTGQYRMDAPNLSEEARLELSQEAAEIGQMLAHVMREVIIHPVGFERARLISACAGRRMEALRMRMELLRMTASATDGKEKAA